MEAKPTKEHAWLQRLVGEWTYESEADMGPDKPAAKAQGSQTYRALGEFWVIGETKGDMPGCGPFKAIITLGFDPGAKRFTGTWVGSPMSHLWIYDGELDAAEKTLTLDSEGPSMTDDGTMAKYRDVIEVESDDKHVLRSLVRDADGTWREFMHSRHTRTA